MNEATSNPCSGSRCSRLYPDTWRLKVPISVRTVDRLPETAVRRRSSVGDVGVRSRPSVSRSPAAVTTSRPAMLSELRP